MNGAVVLVMMSVATAAPTVEQRLARAQAALDDLEYQAAADELAVALSDPRINDQQRFRANLMAGIANRVIGRDVDARMNFIYVLRRDPDVKLPRSAPPKIRTFFELVRQELRDSGRGPSSDAQGALAMSEKAAARDDLRANLTTGRAALSVTSTPPGAAVFLDSKRVGATPFTFDDANPGMGRMEVHRKDGGVVRFEVPLYDNEQTDVRVDYKQQPAPDDEMVLHSVWMAGKLAGCAVLTVVGSGCLAISLGSFGSRFSSIQSAALTLTCTSLLCGLPGALMAGGGLALGGWAVFDFLAPPTGPTEGNVAVKSPREDAPMRFSVPERDDDDAMAH